MSNWEEITAADEWTNFQNPNALPTADKIQVINAHSFNMLRAGREQAGDDRDAYEKAGEDVDNWRLMEIAKVLEGAEQWDAYVEKGPRSVLSKGARKYITPAGRAIDTGAARVASTFRRQGLAGVSMAAGHPLLSSGALANDIARELRDPTKRTEGEASVSAFGIAVPNQGKRVSRGHAPTARELAWAEKLEKYGEQLMDAGGIMYSAVPAAILSEQDPRFKDNKFMYQAFESLVQSTPTSVGIMAGGILTKGAILYPMTFSAEGAESFATVFQDLEKRGIDLETAEDMAFESWKTTGSFNAVLESLPFARLLGELDKVAMKSVKKPFRDIVKSVGIQMGAEAGTEVLQEGVQILSTEETIIAALKTHDGTRVAQAFLNDPGLSDEERKITIAGLKDWIARNGRQIGLAGTAGAMMGGSASMTINGAAVVDQILTQAQVKHRLKTEMNDLGEIAVIHSARDLMEHDLDMEASKVPFAFESEVTPEKTEQFLNPSKPPEDVEKQAETDPEALDEDDPIRLIREDTRQAFEYYQEYDTQAGLTDFSGRVAERGRTLQTQVDQGYVPEDEAWERLRIYRESDDFAELQAQVPGLEAPTSLDALHVLGWTQEEYTEGVYRDAWIVAAESGPDAVVEEHVEAFRNRANRSGLVTDSELTQWHQDVSALRAEMGEEALPALPAGGKNRHKALTEFISDQAKDYLRGRIREGGSKARAILPKAVLNFFEQLTIHLKAVFDRAGMLQEGFASGKLDPKFEAFLSEAVGLDMEADTEVSEKFQTEAARQYLAQSFSVRPYNPETYGKTPVEKAIREAMAAVKAPEDGTELDRRVQDLLEKDARYTEGSFEELVQSGDPYSTRKPTDSEVVAMLKEIGLEPGQQAGPNSERVADYVLGREALDLLKAKKRAGLEALQNFEQTTHSLHTVEGAQAALEALLANPNEAELGRTLKAINRNLKKPQVLELAAKLDLGKFPTKKAALEAMVAVGKDPRLVNLLKGDVAAATSLLQDAEVDGVRELMGQIGAGNRFHKSDVLELADALGIEHGVSEKGNITKRDTLVKIEEELTRQKQPQAPNMEDGVWVNKGEPAPEESKALSDYLSQFPDPLQTGGQIEPDPSTYQDRQEGTPPDLGLGRTTFPNHRPWITAAPIERVEQAIANGEHYGYSKEDIGAYLVQNYLGLSGTNDANRAALKERLPELPPSRDEILHERRTESLAEDFREDPELAPAKLWDAGIPVPEGPIDPRAAAEAVLATEKPAPSEAAQSADLSRLKGDEPLVEFVDMMGEAEQGKPLRLAIWRDIFPGTKEQQDRIISTLIRNEAIAVYRLGYGEKSGHPHAITQADKDAAYVNPSGDEMHIFYVTDQFLKRARSLTKPAPSETARAAAGAITAGGPGEAIIGDQARGMDEGTRNRSGEAAEVVEQEIDALPDDADDVTIAEAIDNALDRVAETALPSLSRMVERAEGVPRLLRTRPQDFAVRVVRNLRDRLQKRVEPLPSFESRRIDNVSREDLDTAILEEAAKHEGNRNDIVSAVHQTYAGSGLTPARIKEALDRRDEGTNITHSVTAALSDLYQGYTTHKGYFHGTKEGTLGRQEEGIWGPGVYLTNDEADARGWAERSKLDTAIRVLPVQPKTRNTLELKFAQDWGSNALPNMLPKKLKAEFFRPLSRSERQSLAAFEKEGGSQSEQFAWGERVKRFLASKGYDSIRMTGIPSQGEGTATHLAVWPEEGAVASPDTNITHSVTVDPAKLARHAELEQKHSTGSITEAETAEAQRLVDEAAKAAGYPSRSEVVDAFESHPDVQLAEKIKRVAIVGSRADRNRTLRPPREMEGDQVNLGSDVDVLIEVAPRQDVTAVDLTRQYRKGLMSRFVRERVSGMRDDLHPQLLGARADLYLTYDISEESGPLVSLEPFTGTRLSERFSEQDSRITHSVTVEQAALNALYQERADLEQTLSGLRSQLAKKFPVPQNGVYTSDAIIQIESSEEKKAIRKAQARQDEFRKEINAAKKALDIARLYATQDPRDGNFAGALKEGNETRMNSIVRDVAADKGFTKTGYHGGAAGISEFRLGSYFASTQGYAEEFAAKGGDNSEITKVYLKPGNRVVSLQHLGLEPISAKEYISEFRRQVPLANLQPLEKSMGGERDEAKAWQWTNWLLADQPSMLEQVGISSIEQVEMSDRQERTDVSTVVASPHQVKSAEAIIRDKEGIIVPPSERFSEQDSRITHSVQVQALLDYLQPQPGPVVISSARHYLDQALQEIAAARNPDPLTVLQDAWEPNWSIVDTQRMSRMLDNIVRMLPKEIRGQVGGHTKLINLPSRQSQLTHLLGRAETASRLLEKWTVDEQLSKIDKLLERYEQKVTDRQLPKGYGPEVQDYLDYLNIVREMTGAEVAQESMDLEANQVTGSEAPIRGAWNAHKRGEGLPEQGTAEALELFERQEAMLSTFGNLEDKSGIELEEAYEVLHDALLEGRIAQVEQEQAKVEERKAVNEEGLATIRNHGPRMTSAEARAREKKMTPHKRVRKNFLQGFMSFEWLLNEVSQDDLSTPTLGSFINDYFGRLVHRSTIDERVAMMENKEHESKALAKIFGVKTKKGYIFNLSNKLIKHKTRQTVEQRDGHHIYRQEGMKWERDSVPVADAQALVTGGETATDYQLNQYSLDNLTDAVAEHNAEVEALQSRIHAEETRQSPALQSGPAAFVQGMQESRYLKKLKRKLGGLQRKESIKFDRNTNEGSKVDLTLSQDEAVYLTMGWRQEGVPGRMKRHGYSAETMAAIESWLTPEAVQVREWLTQEYLDNYEKINAVYREKYGVNMPQNKFYAPLKYIIGGKPEQNLLDTLMPASGGMTPSFVHTRMKQHNAEIRMDVGALSAYEQHITKTEHFVHWADTIKQLHSFFSNKEVQEAIEGVAAGTNLNTLIQERIQMFADGGNRNAQRFELLDQIRGNSVMVALGYNASVFVKQLTSQPAYLYDMPLAKFLKYEAAFWAHPIKNTKEMLAQPWLQERKLRGATRDLQAVLKGAMQTDSHGNAKPKSRIKHLAEQGSITTRVGDIIPIVVGGWASYKYSQELAADRGLKGQEAVDWAWTNQQMMTERAQQAGDTKDMGAWELGGSGMRLWTMYKTTPKQYYLNTWAPLGDAIKGRGGKAARLNFAKRIFIGHIILPSIFKFVEEWVRSWDEEDDPWGEHELGEYALAWLFGPLSGVAIVGDAIMDGVQEGLGMHTWDAQLPVVEALKSFSDPMQEIMELVVGLIRGDEEVTAKDWLEIPHEIVKTTGLLGGTGYGMAYHQLSNQMRRFGGDEYVAAFLEGEGMTGDRAVSKAEDVQEKAWDAIQEEYDEITDTKEFKAKLKADLKSKRIDKSQAETLTGRHETEEEEKEIPSILRKSDLKIRDGGVVSHGRKAAILERLSRLPKSQHKAWLEAMEDEGIINRDVKRQLKEEDVTW